MAVIINTNKGNSGNSDKINELMKDYIYCKDFAKRISSAFDEADKNKDFFEGDEPTECVIIKTHTFPDGISCNRAFLKQQEDDMKCTAVEIVEELMRMGKL